MTEPDPTEPTAAPPRRTWLERLSRLWKPLTAFAGVGAVLGGLAGYWNAYRTVHDSAAAPTTVSATEPSASAKALAVLPFSAPPGDAKLELIADGIGDELVGLLARVPGLKVTARRSSLQFRSQAVAPAEMARQLGVVYLVDGSVRPAGAQLRISAQLVKAADGTVLWSQSFDRAFDDVSNAQAELALQIAARLKLPLDAASLADSGTRNARAWELFLQGQRMPLGQREDFYRRALELDPKFARPHVELARELLRHANQGSTPPDNQALRKDVEAEVQKALRLDPRSAEAHVLLAYAAGRADDVPALEAASRRLMELDPNHPDAPDLAGDLYLLQGRMDDALAAKQRVLELDPLSDVAYANYANLLSLAGRPGDALAMVDRALTLNPDEPRNVAVRARVLLDLGRQDEALVLARRAAAQIAAASLWRWVPADVLARGTAEDQRLLDHMPQLLPRTRALIQLCRGNADAFFTWLAQGETDVPRRGFMLFMPELDGVRDDPRFKAWLARHTLLSAQERADTWRVAHGAARR